MHFIRDIIHNVGWENLVLSFKIVFFLNFRSQEAAPGGQTTNSTRNVEQSRSRSPDYRIPQGPTRTGFPSSPRQEDADTYSHLMAPGPAVGQRLTPWGAGAMARSGDHISAGTAPPPGAPKIGL